VVNPIQQLLRPEGLDPCGSQLDRQRHPVQPRHQPRHYRSGFAVEGELRVGLASPVGEQGHRL